MMQNYFDILPTAIIRKILENLDDSPYKLCAILTCKTFKQFIKINNEYKTNPKIVSTINILKWIQTFHINDQPRWLKPMCSYTSSILAKCGFLDVLKYIHSQGVLLDVHTCLNAIKEGHFDIVRWVYSKVQCWYHISSLNEIITSVANEAAKYGHFKILHWAVYNGCNIDARTSASAAFGGHIKILEWLEELFCDICSVNVSTNAIRGGHIEVFNWLCEKKNCQYNEFTCTSSAAKYGHLQILKYLRSINYAWEESALINSVDSGHLEVVKYLLENNCPISEYILYIAAESEARNNKLEIFKLLFGNNSNYIRRSDICNIAAEIGNWDILMWAYENGCEINLLECLEEASRVGKIDIIKWIYSKGCKWNHDVIKMVSTNIIRCLEDINHEIQIGFHDHCWEWNIDEYKNFADEMDLDKLLAWLLKYKSNSIQDTDDS